MAILDKKALAKRIPIPHEEGQWVEIAPITFGDKRKLAGLGGIEAAVLTIKLVLVGWSYPEPINDETLDALDSTTSDWLAEEVQRQLAGDPKGAGPSAS